MNPAAVMISHASRGGPNGIRKRTLDQLAEVGIQPTIFESTVPVGSDVEVKRIAWEAVSSAYGSEDGVLFFEDDLRIHEEGMHWFVTQPTPRYDLVVLCLLRESLYPQFLVPEMKSKKFSGFRPVQLDAGLFRANRGFHGSMALWLSKSLVEKVTFSRLDFMNEDGSVLTRARTKSEFARGKPCGFDFWLKDNVVRPAVIFPNPVDHIPGVSTVGVGVTPHQSPSFPR